MGYSGGVKPKVITIVGPTSSGKTALSVWLAHKLDGEVISADSRQVYKGLNIGTGKVTKKEMQGVPHHLLDVASPKHVFTASDFKKLGEKVLAKIVKNNRTPLIVGGTGLYVDVFLGRMILPEVPPNLGLRTKLEKKSAQELYALLVKKDPERAATIEPDHKRRLVRALEIADALGKNPSKESAMSGLPNEALPYEVLWLGLNPPQKILDKKIIARIHSRLTQGMLHEATQLHKKGLSYKRMEELGLEYRSMARFLQKKITREGMILELERAIPHYAKRQLKWFKRNPNIRWLKNPPHSRAGKTEALRLAKDFLSR